LKFFKEDGKESIGADSPKEVSLECVLKEVDNHPIEEGNVVGLVNDRGETIQFVS